MKKCESVVLQRKVREPMRIIPERLDHMWFLGYGLDDRISRSQHLASRAWSPARSKASNQWGEGIPFSSRQQPQLHVEPAKFIVEPFRNDAHWTLAR